MGTPTQRNDRAIQVVSSNRKRVSTFRCLFTLFSAANVVVLWFLAHNSIVHETDERPLTVVPLATDTRNGTSVDRHSISSVDYMSCCGAGHRMAKTADASYLARALNFSLRSFWGFCDTSASDPRGSETEIFSHLFGVQPSLDATVSSLEYINTDNMFARINNEVPGFGKLRRRGGSCNETCNAIKAQADVDYYSNLRDQFRLHGHVEKFRAQHFQGKSVIGIHIRAGNGESGDFAAKKRMIENLSLWTNNLVNQVITTTRELRWDSGTVVVFLATDTPSFVDNIRELLLRKTPSGSNLAYTVSYVNQTHPPEGSGVFFGAHGRIRMNGDDCLRGWESSIMDMMLLSHTDVLVAARPSSFTQSLPMSLVLSTSKATRLSPRPYCELNSDASRMECYSGFMDWCCRGRTEFSLKGIQPSDFIRMPHSEIHHLDINDPATRKALKINYRPTRGCIPRPTNAKQKCLPYNWSEFILSRRDMGKMS